MDVLNIILAALQFIEILLLGVLTTYILDVVVDIKSEDDE